MTLSRPALRFAVHEDGALEIRSPWFPFVAFSEVALAASVKALSVSGDELTIRCVNGGALYRLGPPTGGARAGRLVRSW